VELLKLETPDALLIPQLRAAGIDFTVTQDDLQTFAKIGASDALLAVIREVSTKSRVKQLDAPSKAQGYPVGNIIAIEGGPEDAIIGRWDNGDYFKATAGAWIALSPNGVKDLPQGIKDSLDINIEHPLVWLIANTAFHKGADYKKLYQSVMSNAGLALFGKVPGVIVTLSGPDIPKKNIVDASDHIIPSRFALYNLSDQHALEAIALDKNTEPEFREIALSRLTDRDLAARIRGEQDTPMANVDVVTAATNPDQKGLNEVTGSKAKSAPTPVADSTAVGPTSAVPKIPPTLHTPQPKSESAAPSEPARNTSNTALNTQEDKFSYALGMKLGQSLHKLSVPPDPSVLQLGLRDAISGGKTRLTQDEARATITEVMKGISTKHLERSPQAEDKFSYALGMSLGLGLHKQSVPVDLSILQRGLDDALVVGRTLLSEDEAKAALMAAQTDLRQKQQEKMKQTAESNKEEGAAFLEANKGNNGVVTLPSGLQYKILQQGTGPKPTATDSVVCNYRGTFINGMEFDSSYKRGQPATLPVTGVIKGWSEALQLMPVGSKWQLFIPPDLAYGDRGAPADISPGATLIFEVELISIQDKAREKK
jgi:FKBP-type peptidyl-prolyl cis-trans isomerase FklB